MKRRYLLILLVLPLLWTSSSDARSKMSDDAAKSKAISLWGPRAAVAKFWVTGSPSTWLYQVGCVTPDGFHVTGSGESSWESAYLNVDPTKNGPFIITATATQSDGKKATSDTVTVYGCDAVFKKSTPTVPAERVAE